MLCVSGYMGPRVDGFRSRCLPMQQHPELVESVLSGKIDEVDLGEVLCDGCDDYYRDEVELDDAWQAYHDYLDDTDGNYKSWLCGTCGDPAYDCGCADLI